MKTFCDRIDMIRQMPGHEGVEVGTYRGDFAECILGTHVRKLHLVDPYKHYPEYGADSCNQSDAEQERVYQSVLRRFERHFATGRLHIHRRMSLDAIMEFVGNPVDWVYLDANHQKKFVLEDLTGWALVIKPGGYLMGHDYGDFPQAQEIGCGVKEAVEEFCKLTPWKLWALTHEPYSASFCLRRG